MENGLAEPVRGLDAGQNQSSDRGPDLVGDRDLLHLPIVGEINEQNILANSSNRDHPGGHLLVPSGERDRDSAAVGGESFGVGEVDAVQPVPRPKLKLVQPVPQAVKKGRTETGSTRKKKTNVQPVPHGRNTRNANELHPPPLPGCKWKPSGLSGWELYSRRPAISANGKRSSKHKYMAYYSKEAVRKLHDEREKTSNLRRA